MTAAELLVGIDTGTDPVCEPIPGTLLIPCGTTTPGSAWSTSGSFAPGLAAAGGILGSADRIAVGADSGGPTSHAILIAINFDATAVAVDLSKIKLDGVGANALSFKITGAIQVQNAAWPANPSGHAWSVDAGFATGVPAGSAGVVDDPPI